MNTARLTAAVSRPSSHDSGHDHGSRRFISPNSRSLVETINQISKQI